MPMKLEKINKPPRGASLRGVAVELSILYQKSQPLWAVIFTREFTGRRPARHRKQLVEI